MSKLITVFGATGAQGGSVVKSILANPHLGFKIRAITRDPAKPNAQALVAKGVEAVKADLNDAESLRHAVAGSYAVFAVTNFWESKSQETEVKQGKSIADACRAAGVSHIIWSALVNTTKLSNGHLSHITHFDGKAQVTEYIESIKGGMIATYFMPGFYMSNLKSSIRRGPDGVLTYANVFDGEKTLLPLLDTANDSGKFVTAILSADPKSVNGREVHAVSEWMNPNTIISTINEIASTDVVYKQVPDEVYKSFLPLPISDEMTENMILIRDYSYYGKGADKEQAKHNELLEGEKLTSWAEFVETNGPWKWE